MRMISAGITKEKTILLLDKEPKTKNDRTWCFWEAGNGFFEEVVQHTWDRLFFYSDENPLQLNIHPYKYKMIRGIDFYSYCFQRISREANIETRFSELKSVSSNRKGITLHLKDGSINCEQAIVFNSIYRPSDHLPGTLQILQHFKGWLIDTEEPCFNPGHATLMDFRVHQHHGTSFAYVLPISTTSALVEYTLFTRETLRADQYKQELQYYINNFIKARHYTIREEEFGIIPMTNAKFNMFSQGMYNIGTAGGQTKASTGYTFQFIQKQTEAIVDQLILNRPLSQIPASPVRFRFYDAVLLQLLQEGKLPGKEIFSRLFYRNKASLVFRFLDNDTSVKEETALLASLQTIPFLKAAVKQLF